jgi:hypothetical protein
MRQFSAAKEYAFETRTARGIRSMIEILLAVIAKSGDRRRQLY